MMYLLQFVIFVQRQRLSKLKTEPMTKDSLHEHSQPYDVTQAIKHCLNSTNNSPLIGFQLIVDLKRNKVIGSDYKI